MQIDRKDWVPEPEVKVSVPEMPPNVAALIANPDAEQKPTIQVQAGILPHLATECENALISSGAAVFQRGGVLVRPMTWEVSASDERITTAAGLKVLSLTMLIDLLAQNAAFEKYDARAKKYVPTDPPEKAAAILLSRAGQWKLSTVLGVISAPTLRRDGTIMSAPGYDQQTRLYHEPDPALIMPSIPAHPHREDAVAALKLLSELLKHFPFCTDTDRSVALSALISPLVRGALGMVPLHAFTAPAPGTGKSYVADVASAILSGRICPVATAGKSEEETEKRLGALLIAGYPLVSIDNVSATLGGDLLCQMIERPVIRLRPLGKSEIMELESRATVFANGNNLVIEGDMTRRTILARLDAQIERPETRTFDFDPVAVVLADRGRYIAAALTIVRAYILAGRPGKLSALQSFLDWSDNVRSALVWLNQADPVESVNEIRANDPILSSLKGVLEAWRVVFADEKHKASDVVKRLDSIHSFDSQFLELTAMREAIMPVAGVRGMLESRKFGDWLRKNKERPSGGFRFVSDGMSGGVSYWKAEKC